jgi:hypothetical protein
MARVTHVKKAQKKYKTKPKLDADGNQMTQVVLKKNGEPKTTKKGKVVTRKLVEKDLTKPLPNEKCGKCGKEIKPGEPYKHMSIKTSTYGSRRLVRCADCPNWHVWEYRSTRSARAAQIEYENSNSIAGSESVDDIKSIMESAAGEITELAEEAREAQQNIEDGFGHPTYQSEELEQQADDLDNWAQECESWDPDSEEFEPDDEVTKGQSSDDPLNAEGQTEEEWLDAIRESASEVLSNIPV